MFAGSSGEEIQILSPIADEVVENPGEGVGFFLTVHDANGTNAVVDLDCDYFDVFIREVATSVNNITHNSDIKMYPNPIVSNETLLFDLDNNKSNFRILLFSEDGKVVLNNFYDSQSKVSLQIEDRLESGIYTVKILLENMVVIKRLYVVK